jgi:hypothetical protein
MPGENASDSEGECDRCRGSVIKNLQKRELIPNACLHSVTGLCLQNELFVAQAQGKLVLTP